MPARTGVGADCETARVPTLAVDTLLDRLVHAGAREDRLTHLAWLPERAARHADWPGWAAPEVVAALQRQGVDRPWSHQAVAAEQAWAGVHTVIATGTASGKSLAFQLPALSRAQQARGPRGQRGATTLYVSPTKALAQDQLQRLRALGLPDLRAAAHDGDTPREERDWNREHAEYLLTNPDMLHRSLLPGHERWSGFFRHLDFVVIDECHHYRGVFGAHVAQVLRRLRRVCALHGSSPTFVLASATMAEPEVAASRMTGLDVTPVTEDGSPRGRFALALWEPPLTDFLGEHGAPVRRSTSSEVADLVTDLVVEGVRTLAFVRSRRAAETVALTARGHLEEVDPALAHRVAAYRGGYLPEDRRELEDALRRGDLMAVAATNALELGIDVSGLDAVVLGGFPGTRAALWQQVGRAGRAGTDALGVMVARDDPLDTYLVHHPESLLDRPLEAQVFDPDNPYVLGPHLCAAAAESPLTEKGLALFGPEARSAVDALTEAGILRRRPRGWFWTDRSRASDLADIRSSGGSPVRLVDEATGRMIGTVDRSSAHSTVHPGAVYLHMGETWLVRDLDLEESVALVAQGRVDYSTSARELTDIAITREVSATSWGAARLSLGAVRVTHQVVGYLKKRVPSGEVLGTEPLDLPEQTLDTTAVWWTLPDDVLADAGMDERDLPGAAHAAEHASIGLLPLFATCDRWDIGGVSTALHPDTGLLTVFVHDGHPGGAGFAERGFHTAAAWLRATRDAIAACECVEGCPSCVQSPKCGNQNDPLDKAGAITLLDLLLRDAPAG